MQETFLPLLLSVVMPICQSPDLPICQSADFTNSRSKAMPFATSFIAWMWSPKAISISHFIASTFSSAHPLSTFQARRGAMESSLLPSSLAIEPVRHEINGGVKRRPKFSFVEDDRFTPLRRRPRLSCALKTARWRPLWARIFFASKKVRSIILLNLLTVIYGYKRCFIAIAMDGN